MLVSVISHFVWHARESRDERACAEADGQTPRDGGGGAGGIILCAAILGWKLSTIEGNKEGR